MQMRLVFGSPAAQSITRSSCGHNQAAGEQIEGYRACRGLPGVLCRCASHYARRVAPGSLMLSMCKAPIQHLCPQHMQTLKPPCGHHSSLLPWS